MSTFRINRVARSVALGTGFVLALTFLSFAPPALAQASLSITHSVKSVPGRSATRIKRKTTPKKANIPAAVALPDDVTYTVSTPTGTVATPTKTKGPHRSTPSTVAGPWRALGDTGIRIAAASTVSDSTASTDALRNSSSPTPLRVPSVTARLLSGAERKRLGVSGLAIELTRTGNDKSGPVAVQIPQKYLTGAYGADYASRISWQQTTINSATDSTSAAVPTSGDLSPPSQTIDPDTKTAEAVPVASKPTSGSTVLTPFLASSSVVVAAVTSPTSSTGTGSFAATPLNPAGSWNVSAQTGDFSWSYPMRVPPAAAGPSPASLALSYDSQMVDGNTGGTNNQSSTVGVGWSQGGGGNIQRQYVTCSQDTTPVTTSQDQCWSNDNATLTLDGHSGELVKDASTGTWKIVGDDGTRITHLTSSSASDPCVNNTTGTNYTNECWLITTTDGTKYYFGMNELPGWTSTSATPVTNSTWTAPVYGNDSGEPCHASSFATSHCTMGWQWNLDYVVDVHGNAEALYYNREIGKYDRAGSTLNVDTYIRGGSINHIDYGIVGNAPYGSSAASDKVVFTYNANGRCATSCTAESATGEINTNPAHPTSYPDVPWDLNCTASTCPNQTSPSFWSDAELESVTTEAHENVPAGSSNMIYSPVDTWTLAHTFTPAVTGDSTSAALWLSSISHTGTSGYAATVSGTTTTPLSATEPATTFTSVPLQNRVWASGSSYTPLDQFRISAINTSLGAQIVVNYSAKQCTTSMKAAILASPQTNANRCFPQYWSPTPGATPVADLFHKYVVSSVVSNPETGGGADQSLETHYDYSLGTPAWRFNAATGVQKKYRTWSDFSGYDKVRVEVGSSSSPSLQTTTEYTFFQGMHGDPLNTSGTSTETNHVDGASSPLDQQWWAGQVYRTRVFAGSQSGAPLLSATVTTPWASDATAVPAVISGQPVRQSAYMTGAAESVTTAPLSDRGAAQRGLSTPASSVVDTTTTHSTDGHGLVTSVSTVTTDTDGTTTVSDAKSTCTTTTYATPNTTDWIIGLPSEVDKVAIACPDLSTATYPADAIADTETIYDGGSVGSAATAGEASSMKLVESYSGSSASSANWVTSSQTSYDSLGRPTSVTTLVNSQTTPAITSTASTAYTPAASGPLTGEAETNNAGWNVATDVIDPEWGKTVTSVDQNGRALTTGYDGLGRVVAGWKADRPKATFPTSPSVSYVYSLSTTAASSIESISVGPSTNLVSYSLIDGLGRSVQTQSPAEGGGADVADTAYDAAGNVSRTNSPYWTSSVSASGTLFVPTSESAIPSEALNEYDGAGRVTSSTIYSFGTAHSVTTAAYKGSDETDATPPGGGTPTSTFVNTLGQMKKLVQYLSSAVDASATTETTLYAYGPQGSMTSMKDPDGNEWTWSYNILGQNTGASDPDTGATSTNYDEAGDVLSTTDARNVTLAYKYDSLQRKIEEDQVNTGSTPNTELASWSYDPTGAKGKLASSTSYVGSTPGIAGAAYTETVAGYDDAYRALGQKISIPTAAPAFGSSTPYETDYTYNAAGALATTKYQAAGGLPSETVKTSYDAFGNSSALSTTSTSYTITSYNPLGQVQQQYRTGSSGQASAATAFGYNPATNAVSQIETVSALAGSSQIAENNNYTYDSAGNVTSIAMTSGILTSDTQCFRYDHVQNLTEAWTPSNDDCTDAPSISGLGGAAPYWYTYAVDPATGNRTTETRHGAGESGNDAVSDYHYPTAGSANPHGVQCIQQTDCADGSTRAYSYDAAGDTTARPGETISYDPEGKVSTINDGTNTQSNIYDANGNLLLQTDSATGTTFFDGATELHVVSGSSSVSGERIYSANGAPVAERTSSAGSSSNTLIWLVADAQGTVNLEVNTSTGVLSYRAQDPFGNSRGGSPAWSDDRGYLHAPVSAFSGLTQLGARVYDPTIGRFLSVDPVLEATNPLQNNGYAYAQNDPITRSDPTGLLTSEQTVCSIPGNECGIYAKNPGSGSSGSSGSSGGSGSGGSSGGASGASNGSSASVPPVPRQSLAERLWWEVWQKVWNNAGFNEPNLGGVIHTQANPLQLLGGYNDPYDVTFKVGTGGAAENIKYKFQYRGKSYVVWAWKGEYLQMGDGAEVGFYTQNKPLNRAGPLWNSDTGDPDLPKMSVSLSEGGSTVASFAPEKPQVWVGSWNPRKLDRDTGAMNVTDTVTFQNSGMYTAFRKSRSVLQGQDGADISWDADTNTAKISW